MSDDDVHEVSKEELRARSLKETTIDRPTGRLVLTLDDVTAIQKSLHAYLLATDRPDSGWFEDRERLLLEAQDVGWIDADGAVRISTWVLDAQNEPLRLWLRIPGEETAPVIRAYVAELAYDEPWRVVSVTQARIRRR